MTSERPQPTDAGRERARFYNLRRQGPAHRQHDEFEAQDHWDDPDWIEECFRLWCLALAELDPERFGDLEDTMTSTRPSWDGAYRQSDGIDTSPEAVARMRAERANPGSGG